MATSRANAVVDLPVELRQEFLSASVLYDPFSIRLVEIININTGLVEVTYGGAVIDKITTGEYSVDAGPFLSEASYQDKWYYTAASGDPETTQSGVFTVRSVSDVGEDPSLLMTVEYFRKVFLFGLDLTDDEGNDYPTEMFTQAIQYATDLLEKWLDVDLFPREYSEANGNPIRMDYVFENYAQFATFVLDHKPIRELLTVKAVYPSDAGGQTIIDFPREWFSVADPLFGQINITPGGGSLASYVLGQGGAYLPLIRSGFSQMYPTLWLIEAKTGFEPGTVPRDVIQALGMLASIPILDTAGDLVIGVGVASKSVGIDALHFSVNTTSSATNAAFGARIGSFDTQLKRLIPILRDHFHGIKMGVV